MGIFRYFSEAVFCLITNSSWMFPLLYLPSAHDTHVIIMCQRLRSVCFQMIFFIVNLVLYYNVFYNVSEKEEWVETKKSRALKRTQKGKMTQFIVYTPFVVCMLRNDYRTEYFVTQFHA